MIWIRVSHIFIQKDKRYDSILPQEAKVIADKEVFF